MKKLMLFSLAIVLIFSTSVVFAGGPNGPKQGNDNNPFNNLYKWLRDADGDGIPNCDDEDWTPPQDGTGYGHGSENDGNNSGDCNGDGNGNGDGTCDGDGNKYQKGSGSTSILLGGDQNHHRHSYSYEKKYQGENKKKDVEK